MPKYYFVATFLPALAFGTPPKIDSKELDFILELNLTSKDLKQVKKLRSFVDIENIRFLWQNRPIQSGGNFFDPVMLADALYLQTSLPEYVYAYLEKYVSNEDRIVHFGELLQEAFQAEIDTSDGVLKKYFELQWRATTLLTALRSTTTAQFAEEMINPDDPFVDDILAQQIKGDRISLEEPYDELFILFQQHKTTPFDLELHFYQWMFDQIDRLPALDKPFSIDRVLAYVAQLRLVEKWSMLSAEQGLKIVEQMVH